MRIHILVLDGVLDIGLASLTDVIAIAGELAAADTSRKTPVHFDVHLVGVRRKLRTARGLSIPVEHAADLPMPDVVLVPALGVLMPQPLLEALERPDVKEAQAWLKQWVNAGASVGAACTGTFLLAEAGLLDEQSATTSWWLSSLFRQRYPQVVLDESRMLVNSASFTTAGAALAHLDLGLALVRSRSPTLAALCGRYLLIESRNSQSVFVIPDHVAHTDPIVERFEHWARGRLAQGFSMSEAAHAIGTSERTLNRRLQAVLGKSPLAYFRDLRVERAVHLLQTSDDSVDHIAAEVGYSDGTTLRTLLRQKLGKGVRELRGRGL